LRAILASGRAGSHLTTAVNASLQRRSRAISLLKELAF
jgi:hypothetical protein